MDDCGACAAKVCGKLDEADRVACFFGGRGARALLAGAGTVAVADPHGAGRILAIEQEDATLALRFGAVVCVPASTARSADALERIGSVLSGEARRRRWAFIRWLRPATGDRVVIPDDAEVWFEISKPTRPQPTPALAGISLRVARPEDETAVTEMLERSLLAGLNRFQREHLPPRYPLHTAFSATSPLIVVAAASSGPLGCLFGDLSATSAHDGETRGRIVDVFVTEQALGRGIATLLAHVFEVACRELGIAEMAGTVEGGDYPGTLSLLARLGSQGWKPDTMLVDFRPRRRGK